MKSKMLVTVVLAVAMVAAVAGSASAAIVLSEPFNGTLGADITTLGWTFVGGNGTDVISSQLVDEGTSAGRGATPYSTADYRKGAVGTMDSAESATLTWTAFASNTGGGDPQYGNNTMFVKLLANNNDDYFGAYFYNGTTATPGDAGINAYSYVGGVFKPGAGLTLLSPRETLQMRVIVGPDSSYFQYYEPANTTWIQWDVHHGPAGGSGTSVQGVLIERSGNAGIDSIQLDAIIPEPEVGALLVLGVGMMRLAGFAIRRRK